MTRTRARRGIISCLFGLLAVTLAVLPAVHATSPVLMLGDPIFVYNDWSSYDELSDNVKLTERLAMRELDQILRLRRYGVHFDGYMMDAFWFAKDGAYRTWRKDSWPNGPDRWIARCRTNGLRPGMWFSTNALVKIDAAEAWKNSVGKNGWTMSFSEGGFLPDFMQVLQYWYDRGIRMFKFDFADFDAATAQAAKTQTPAQIHSRNVTALYDALRQFREKNPDVILVAYNGFGGDLDMTSGPFPFKNQIDLRWLEVFDSIYSGDPRPSDVPQMSFWRSMDIYGDHMVRRFEQSGVPLERIDSCAFMLGNTGTIYYRKTHAWKGMMIGTLARGGWVNTVHGSLEFIGDADARWFARVQSMYMRLQALGRTHSFGGIPGDVEPYGFVSTDGDGTLYTVTNPTQSERKLTLPAPSRFQGSPTEGRILFRDAGFVPTLRTNTVTLGAGQMAVVGFGRFADARYDLGIQEDVRIPRWIHPIHATFRPGGEKCVETVLTSLPKGALRIVLQQRDAKGNVRRTWAGGPPKGTPMGKVLTVSAMQDGRPVPVKVDYDRRIWSGLSWGVGEIPAAALTAGHPLTVRCASTEKDPVRLDCRLYEVRY